MNFLPLAKKTDHLYFKPLKQFLKNALSLSFIFQLNKSINFILSKIQNLKIDN